MSNDLLRNLWLMVLVLLATGCEPLQPAPPAAEPSVVSIAGLEAHIRDYAPRGAAVYLEASSEIGASRLDSLAAAIRIPVGRREQVLRCPHACVALNEEVVLVWIYDMHPFDSDSASVKVMMGLYTPGREEAYAVMDLLILQRDDQIWRLSRAVRIGET